MEKLNILHTPRSSDKVCGHVVAKWELHPWLLVSATPQVQISAKVPDTDSFLHSGFVMVSQIFKVGPDKRCKKA